MDCPRIPSPSVGRVREGVKKGNKVIAQRREWSKNNGVNTAQEQIETTTLLLTESKEALVDEIIRLRREVRELKERLEKEAAKEAERKSREQDKHKPIKSRWKKLGAPVGHHGATRPKPDHIDRTIEQHLDSCPDCGCSHMSACPSADSEHIQEDIIPARVEVTKFIHHGYWCPCCAKVKVEIGRAHV